MLRNYLYIAIRNVLRQKSFGVINIAGLSIGVEELTWSMLGEEFVLTNGDNSFRQNGGYASPDFFKVFSFSFIKGNPQTALKYLNGIVITDRLATTLFGQDWQSPVIL